MRGRAELLSLSLLSHLKRSWTPAIQARGIARRKPHAGVLSGGVELGSRRLGNESETLVRLLACAYRVISKRLGDSRFSGKGAVARRRARRLLVGDGSSGHAWSRLLARSGIQYASANAETHEMLAETHWHEQARQQVLRRISHTPGPIQAVAHGVFEEAP